MAEWLAQLVFWAAGIALIYPYIIYPVTLMAFVQLLGKRPVTPDPGSELPTVTLVVSAYNEEAVIAKKIANALSLDYPPEQLNVVVVSDASSDGTDTVVLELSRENARVSLHRRSERGGKTAGLNTVVPTIDTDLIVFSDANAMYEPQAIKELVAPFRAPDVGYVVGAALYYDADEGDAARSEGTYWDFELAQKQMESDLDSVVGGDGAIYAIRSTLFWPLAADDINDFVNPLQIVAAGYRGVFQPSARCFEAAADTFGKEFGRKRRIVNRSWRAVLRNAGAVSPLRRPAFTYCLIAHKVVRWFGAPLVVLQLAAASYLAVGHASYFYGAVGAAIVASMALGVAGLAMDSRPGNMPRWLAAPYYFYLVSIAALLGIWDQARGVRHTTWQHVRGDS